MNAEQIIAHAMKEWDERQDLPDDMTTAQFVALALREAGLDIDHTYEPATAALVDQSGEPVVAQLRYFDDDPLFRRRPLGAGDE